MIYIFQAYIYTDAIEIIDIEMNQEFYDIQYYIVNQYEMDDRIEILHKN